MIQSDKQLRTVSNAFQAAALGGDWAEALAGLAAVTGSRASKLLGLGSEDGLPFICVSDLGPKWVREFLAAGGGDPASNPHIREASLAREMEVLQSADYLTSQELQSSAFLADYCHQHDIPYICQTPLIKEPDQLVGLAVMRSKSQGEISARQRAVFTSIAPHAQAAVHTQRALDYQAVDIVSDALAALSLAAFICDRRGAVKAMTPAAEALMVGDSPLRLREGLLGTGDPVESRELSDAIAAAAGGPTCPDDPVLSTLLIRGKRGRALVLDIAPMSQGARALSFAPRVLVVAGGRQRDVEHLKLLLQAAYKLTSAEVEVALMLVDEYSPDAIAARRSTSVGTTRAQIRAIYAKLDVRRQSDLVSRLRQWN